VADLTGIAGVTAAGPDSRHVSLTVDSSQALGCLKTLLYHVTPVPLRLCVRAGRND
jgi:hypothetical protein